MLFEPYLRDNAAQSVYALEMKCDLWSCNECCQRRTWHHSTDEKVARNSTFAGDPITLHDVCTTYNSLTDNFDIFSTATARSFILLLCYFVNLIN